MNEPSVEELIEWDRDGYCYANCPHECKVEPDGICEHGNQSWLLEMGLI
jgi:hypothetical protein